MLVGVIANPVSSKDIRRLVGLARVVDIEEKANILARFLAGLATVDVEVLALDDASGLVRRAARVGRHVVPPIRFLDVEARADETDTRRAAAAFRESGVDILVTLGGDGTVRAAVEAWPDALLVPIAAGTNNAIALTDEPTILGWATARSLERLAYASTTAVTTVVGGEPRTAVIDLVSTRDRWVGARALWDTARLVEGLVTSSRRSAVGLASVASAFGPLAADHVRHLRFGGRATVEAVFSPGLVVDVPVADHADLPLGATVDLDPTAGVIALDGERLGLGGERPVASVVTGPRILDVAKALETPRS